MTIYSEVQDKCFAQAMRDVLVCQKNAYTYHACLLCCHENGSSIKHDKVVMRVLRAQSVSMHIFCLFITLQIIQDLSL